MTQYTIEIETHSFHIFSYYSSILACFSFKIHPENGLQLKEKPFWDLDIRI